MPLPRGDEYNASVQNPHTAFTDPDLKSSSVEITPLGLPKPYSGGFTTTYKLSNSQGTWAVRCFHRDIQDLQERYQQIEDFLSKNPSYFVEAKYLAEGINIEGKGYHPIIKMRWADGEPLNIYLSKLYNQSLKVKELLVDFVQAINKLEQSGIAHGDLQHGNIIVENDRLLLIDYDGMYLPKLASLKTNEIGHVNYQHPKRSASHYNQYIDRFSSIVIYLGLKAISLKPDLWNKYENSENILFRSCDYGDLQHSPLIDDLKSIAEIKPLVERLIGCCYLDFEKVPSLKDFLSGKFNYSNSTVGTISITRSQYEIIDATQKGSLLERVGERVEVVGRIFGKKLGVSRHDSPYIFLNLGGGYPNQTFTLVLWQKGIDAFASKGISPDSLDKKYVSATGVISKYDGKPIYDDDGKPIYDPKPEMIIEQATQIQILADENEANQRLNPPIPQPKKEIDKDAADILNKLYKDKPVYTPAQDNYTTNDSLL